MDDKINFWTLCPYCYIYYEYPKKYEECTLQCQNCQRGFHAVVIRSPPLNEIDSSLCTWGFFPLGFSGDSKDVNGASSNWNPIAPLFPSSVKGSSNRTDSDNAGEKEVVERPGGSATSAADGNENEKNVGVVDAAGVKGSSNMTYYGNAGEKEVVERPGGSANGASAGNESEKNVGAVDASGVKGSSNRTDSGNAGEKEAVERRGGSATGATAGNGNEKNVDAVDVVGVKGSSNRTDFGNAGEKEVVERLGESATGAAPGNGNEKNVGAVDAAGVKADTSKKAVQSSSMRTGAGNLDLNVEFNNDMKEPSCLMRACEDDATSDAGDDVEWDDFLKGLDVMIRNLPFLNVEEDDKVKGH
ncbi:Chaperone DnaJ-domain superfamily protein [Trifolium repens]|nr:Chaperone DnaJ-domain superfamily protein [Trifolium repens]